MQPPSRPLPTATTDDHGGLLVYRLWHPTRQRIDARELRTWGPIFRFDPQPGDPEHPGEDPDGRGVWYAGEALETAVREVFDRAPRDDAGAAPQVAVCANNQLVAVRLASPTQLVDLTRHAVWLGADEDIGDRADTDYDETRGWARTIFEDLAPDGLRYFSARHRGADGSRVGVNIALWRGPVGEAVSEVALSHPGAWRRVHTILTRAGVAVEPLAWCPRCVE